MSGITGLGTTYNLPNYTGILFQLTPDATPLLSMIGGLTGGGQATSKEFEWETFDLRSASQRTQLEGATAPTAEERVRANVTNITQIHQEKVSVSYTKQAAIGEKAGLNNMAPNPVMNELDWQVAQALKQIALDINWSFINGTYNKPADNTTKRKTRGLRQAIVTNRLQKGTILGTALPATAATDLFTSAGHGMANGTKLYLRNINVTNGLTEDVVYFVVGTAANTFQLALTLGGAAIDITADSTADVIKLTATALAVDVVSDLLQAAFDSGGIAEPGMTTLLCNSTQKRNLTKAYASAYGQYHETSRTVGGVAVDTIVTDFGTLNVKLDRHMPQHEIAIVSLEQLRPIFLEVPGKGHMFAEPLAKTGASDEVQMYGETGLQYGSERSHGILTGLAA